MIYLTGFLIKVPMVQLSHVPDMLGWQKVLEQNIYKKIEYHFIVYCIVILT